MKVFDMYFKLMRKHIISLILYGILFFSINIIINMELLKQDEERFGVRKVPILLINRDEENEFLDSFKTYLENYVEFKDIKDDEETVKDALFHHEVHYILTVPEGFTEKFMGGEACNLIKETQPARQDSVHSVDSAVNNFLN